MEQTLQTDLPNRLNQVSELLEIADRLANLTDRVRVQQNVDRSTAVAINSVSTEVLPATYPVNSFTKSLSSINYTVTVESLAVAVKDFTVRIYKAMLDAWRAVVAWFKDLYDWVMDMFTDTKREQAVAEIINKGIQDTIREIPHGMRSQAEHALQLAIANADNSGKFEKAKVYFTNSLVLSVVNKDWLWRLYDKAFTAFNDYLDIAHHRVAVLAKALKFYLGNNRTANSTVIGWLEEACEVTSAKQRDLQQAIRSHTAALDLRTFSSGACLTALKDLALAHKADRHINPEALTIRKIVESKINNLSAFPNETRESLRAIEEYVDAQERALPNIAIPDSEVSSAVRALVTVIREDIVGLHAFKETQATFVRLANAGAKLHTQYEWYLYHAVRDAVASDKEATLVVHAHVAKMNANIKRL